MIAWLVGITVASTIGSVHCVAMCGPLVGLASADRARVRVHLPVLGASPASATSWSVIKRALRSASTYNVGRLLGYVTLGVVAGGLGLALGSLAPGAAAAAGSKAALPTLLAGWLMVGGGALALLRVAGLRRPGRASARVARWSATINQVLARRFGTSTTLAFGALTSLLPCGWLWAFVLTAASTADPIVGGAVMLAFWAGTVPALTVVGALMGAGVGVIGPRLRAATPWVMPALVVAVGAFLLTVRLPSPPALHDETAPAETAPAKTGAIPTAQDAPCHH